MLSAPESDRQEYLGLLSRSYTLLGSYPAESLDKCEVALVEAQPTASGGYGECWKGLFLGNHKVAMKCSLSYIPDEEALKVCTSILLLYSRRFFLTRSSFLPSGPNVRLARGGACSTQMFYPSSGSSLSVPRLFWCLPGWKTGMR